MDKRSKLINVGVLFTFLGRIIQEIHLYKQISHEALFQKSDLLIIDAIDKRSVDDKRFQTDDAEVAPPPKVETPFCSQPVLVKQGKFFFNVLKFSDCKECLIVK